jgi:hypothetical protein
MGISGSRHPALGAIKAGEMKGQQGKFIIN